MLGGILIFGASLRAYGQQYYQGFTPQTKNCEACISGCSGEGPGGCVKGFGTKTTCLDEDDNVCTGSYSCITGPPQDYNCPCSCP
jgi:hypothetical protein